MQLLLNHRELSLPLSAAERSAVMDQVDRLAESHYFRNSRRYPDFVRHIVERTLDGQPNSLKERTLGIEVFEREPTYDTASDSIVRVAAAEVRKRLAQYYQEEGHEQELRIDLPPGSYVPHFRVPRPPLTVAASGVDQSADSGNSTLVHEPIISDAEEVPTAVASLPYVRPQRNLRLLLICLALVVGFISGLLATKYAHPPYHHDWLLDSLLGTSQEGVLICIGAPLLNQNQPATNNGTSTQSLGVPTTNNTLLPFADAITAVKISKVLLDYHHESRIELAKNASFSDLRSQPTILIGGFDNPWTLRLTSSMPFRFIGDDAGVGSIVDYAANKKVVGQVDVMVPYSDRTQDYAIIALIKDDILGCPVLVIAGIGPNGNIAAMEFIGDQNHLEAVLKTAPKAWNGRNLEIVLATQVIEGRTGPPVVEGARFW